MVTPRDNKIFDSMEPQHQNTKKNKKPKRTQQNVMYSLRGLFPEGATALSLPPGASRGRNRFITVWVWIGSRFEHKFTWLFFLCFFWYLAQNLPWGQILSRGVTISFCHLQITFANKMSEKVTLNLKEKPREGIVFQKSEDWNKTRQNKNPDHIFTRTSTSCEPLHMGL